MRTTLGDSKKSYSLDNGLLTNFESEEGMRVVKTSQKGTVMAYLLCTFAHSQTTETMERGRAGLECMDGWEAIEEFMFCGLGESQHLKVEREPSELSRLFPK